MWSKTTVDKANDARRIVRLEDLTTDTDARVTNDMSLDEVRLKRVGMSTAGVEERRRAAYYRSDMIDFRGSAPKVWHRNLDECGTEFSAPTYRRTKFSYRQVSVCRIIDHA